MKELPRHLQNRRLSQTALTILAEVHRRHAGGLPPPSFRELSVLTGHEMRWVQQCVRRLLGAGLITQGDGGGLVTRRSLVPHFTYEALT